jgi:hypothetical protein
VGLGAWQQPTRQGIGDLAVWTSAGGIARDSAFMSGIKFILVSIGFW